MRGIPDPGAPSGYFAALERYPADRPVDDWSRDTWWSTEPVGEPS